jgi:hypothetical protein
MVFLFFQNTTIGIDQVNCESWGLPLRVPWINGLYYKELQEVYPLADNFSKNWITFW